MPSEVTPNLNDVRSEIQPTKLKEAGFTFLPQRVSLIEGINSDKEHVYYVYLVYSNNTPEPNLAWKKIEPIVTWVRKHVWDRTGQTTWPYVKVKREQELPPELVNA